jgi:hypothetical protein
MVVGSGPQAQEQFINALTIKDLRTHRDWLRWSGIIEPSLTHGEIFMVGCSCAVAATTLGFSGAIQIRSS